MKKRLLVLLLAYAATIPAFGQSQVQTFTQIIAEQGEKERSVEATYQRLIETMNSEVLLKCTTPVHIFAHKHRTELSNPHLHKREPRKSKSNVATYVSPSGKFSIEYSTAGADAVPATDGNSNGVPDYVEWTAQAADSSYNLQVNILGFTDPIPEGEVYEIEFYNSNFYGEVRTYSNADGPGTYMLIENDFVGFPENDDPNGDQRGALRATVAHEFKHAIQFAQNDFTGDADLWAEMDATLMEEVTYDQVNDYYNYLGGSGDVFGNPGVTVIPGSYEDATWALFFHERFGQSFWPETWDRIENSVSDLPLLTAVDQELADRGIDYTEALQELYAWHFASGAYWNTSFGFDESRFYPTPNVQSNITQVNDQFSGNISLGRFSAWFGNVNPPTGATGDASFLMDADSIGLSLAVVGLFKEGNIEFEFAEEESGFWVVNEGWKWEDLLRVGMIVVNERQFASGRFRVRVSDTFPTSIPIDDEKPTEVALKQNYPNPFNPETNIPVSLNEFQKVKVDIFDITGRFVQSVFEGGLPAGNYSLPVNMEKYASGVYIYRLQTADQVLVRRMTLVK